MKLRDAQKRTKKANKPLIRILRRNKDDQWKAVWQDNGGKFSRAVESMGPQIYEIHQTTS